MTNWETLIADRKNLHSDFKDCRISDPVKRNARVLANKYDRTEKRIAQHRAWDKSYAGRMSMKTRGKRYRSTEKGKASVLRKSRKYYAVHKDEPSFKLRKRESGIRFRAKRKAQKMSGEYVFHLIGQTITTALFAA